LFSFPSQPSSGNRVRIFSSQFLQRPKQGKTDRLLKIMAEEIMIYGEDFTQWSENRFFSGDEDH